MMVKGTIRTFIGAATIAVGVLSGSGAHAQPQPLLAGIFSGSFRVLPQTKTDCKVSGKIYVQKAGSSTKTPLTDGMEVGLGSTIGLEFELSSSDGERHPVKIRMRYGVGSSVNSMSFNEINRGGAGYQGSTTTKALGKCPVFMRLESEGGESFERRATINVGVPDNVVLSKPQAVPTGHTLDLKPVNINPSGLSTPGIAVNGGVGTTLSSLPNNAPKKFSVPDVKGMSLGAARTALQNAGFPAPAVAMTGEKPPANLKGKVKDQRPFPGTQLPAPIPVQLVVYTSR